MQTASLLQLQYQHREYAGLSPYIVAERRAVMIDTLKAIDEALAANARLVKATMAAYSEEVLAPFDLSAMANNLGPFSANIRLISQHFRGETAIVTFQEGENVPVIHAEFVWAEGRWQYRPEAMPSSLPGEIRKLAESLRALGDSTERGASFAAYCEALDRNVLPQMIRVVTAQDGSTEALVAGNAEED